MKHRRMVASTLLTASLIAGATEGCSSTGFATNDGQSFYVYENTGADIIGLGCNSLDRIDVRDGIGESSVRQLLYGSLRNPGRCIRDFSKQDLVQTFGYKKGIGSIPVGSIISLENGFVVTPKSFGIHPLSDERKYKLKTNVAASPEFNAKNTIGALEEAAKSGNPTQEMIAVDRITGLKAPTNPAQILSLDYVCDGAAANFTNILNPNSAQQTAMDLGTRYADTLDAIGSAIDSDSNSVLNHHWGEVTQPAHFDVVSAAGCVMIESYNINPTN